MRDSISFYRCKVVDLGAAKPSPLSRSLSLSLSLSLALFLATVQSIVAKHTGFTAANTALLQQKCTDFAEHFLQLSRQPPVIGTRRSGDCRDRVLLRFQQELNQYFTQRFSGTADIGFSSQPKRRDIFGPTFCTRFKVGAAT